MKGFIPEAILEGKGGKKHCIPTFLFQPVGLDAFGNQEA